MSIYTVRFTPISGGRSNGCPRWTAARVRATRTLEQHRTSEVQLVQTGGERR